MDGMKINPHKEEWDGLRQKYWRAHTNFGRNHKVKRRYYWARQISKLGARLQKLALRYPPVRTKAAKPIVSIKQAKAYVEGCLGQL